MTRVIVDAFGGDNAPLEVIKGCERAVRELGVAVTLTGNSDKIKKCAADNGISLSGIDIEHTDDVFDIHEEPKEIIRSGKNSSMAVGLQLLADGKGDQDSCLIISCFVLVLIKHCRCYRSMCIDYISCILV